MLSGLVIDTLGWQWLFKIMAIIASLVLVLLFLFVPETSYSPSKHITGISITEGNSVNSSEVVNIDPEKSEISLAEEQAPQPRISFARRLLPVQRRISKHPLMTVMLRPFILIFHPAMLWVCCYYSYSSLAADL